MIAAVVAVHIVVCITIVIVVLLQQGKGADVGAVFGGSSSTVFGASGAGNFLTKLTWGCAVLFFSTSIFLAYTSTRRVTGSIFEGRVRLPSQTAPSGRGGTTSATHPAVPAPLKKGS
jgi:preprotein translocase subunit SecG